jgi:hypothetical protein
MLKLIKHLTQKMSSPVFYHPDAMYTEKLNGRRVFKTSNQKLKWNLY